MSYIRRYLEKNIREDLEKKMVFITGPRQCGKTTLAMNILKGEHPEDFKQRYLNWDSALDREKIIRERFPPGKGVLILDEIHKFKRWRQVVKGLFDKRKNELKIIVTGSGRLDYYRYGGDSLQGRYYLYRLHPFSLPEVNDYSQGPLTNLMKYGGFPEPFLSNSLKDVRRWSRAYCSRLLYEDLRSLENVMDVSLLEQLALRLPDLSGSPLSINSLREDLQVSHGSVSRWLKIFENIYMIFRIYPFGAPKIRAVKKEAKHYHFDWTVIEDESYRFENLIACHLLKWTHFLQDTEGRNVELRYFRDIDLREVDFVITENGKPTHFIECKLKQKEPGKGLRYLKIRFPEVKALQLWLYGEEDYVNKDGINVLSAENYLQGLI